MRPPKGFSANYFTLAAIQATVAQVHQNAIAACCKTHRRFGRSADKGAECEEPPCEDEALSSPTILAIKTPRRRHRPYASTAPPFGVALKHPICTQYTKGTP